jgi:hypothetical protein
MKIALALLALLLPSAYAQDLCQTTLPQNVAQLETVGFISRAKLVSLQLPKDNRCLVLPVFEVGAGALSSLHHFLTSSMASAALVMRASV